MPDKMNRRAVPACLLLLLAESIAPIPDAMAVDAPLPNGVQAIWDVGKAHRETTTTRERICLNGLWRWQPQSDDAPREPQTPPTDRWGYFKVPGFWPGRTNYIQEDTQTLFTHPDWKNANLSRLNAAWYQREFSVPAEWTGRRVTLRADYVNSLAVVFIDGRRVGDLRYPGGEIDLTAVCKPGGKHLLSMSVHALPLKGVLLSYSDTNAARTVKGDVERRGLCGDVWLASAPAGPRIADVKVETSVRKRAVAISVAPENLVADRKYQLRIRLRVRDGVDPLEWTTAPFGVADLKEGWLTTTRTPWLPAQSNWRPAEFWDVRTPQHQCEFQITLAEAGGRALDDFAPVRFGFREFWIDGRDFHLNGSRIFLSMVPLDNAQLGARTAGYTGAVETLKRLQSFGINFVYTHHYGCQPGSHLALDEILRAADDVGMLVGLSQPHFSDYDWKSTDAERDYARHAAFYVRAAQNHPSVVAYVMSHNATGYDEDMNPDLLAGPDDPRTDRWSKNNAAVALRAEAIVRRLDPSRIVYHHAGGDIGVMHTSNFYLNFTPIQEVCDWFEHWSKHGVKPMVTVEYGVPFTWDWTMYRGWYKGEREFGSAAVPWDFRLAEWNAQFLGDRAYKISDRHRRDLRWEAERFKRGAGWHRWDYPHHVGSPDFDERNEVFARYITANWRAFRALGLSGNSPWEYHVFWNLKSRVKKERRTFPVDWAALQRPGFSADYTERRDGAMPTDFEASDWLPNAAGAALIRNNRPLLAFIGGTSGHETRKDHNYRPGEEINKQVFVVNNSREPVHCDLTDVSPSHRGGSRFGAPTGEISRSPVSFRTRSDQPPGPIELRVEARFGAAETQRDVFRIDVLPTPEPPKTTMKIALFDPKGESAALLRDLNIGFATVDASADLSPFDLLIIGKGALTPHGPAPTLTRVRDGLKVLVFEQRADALERRLGFRVAEYGLREVFPRIPNHPALTGLSEAHLHDWRGDATLVPPRRDYKPRPRYGPTIQWCGIDVPQAWRCGCRGVVASVLIEKPACGDFLPIIDGGFALQYSPLLEYREGKGAAVFCQLDVTGRTESDPAAEILVANLLRYLDAWQPHPHRQALYVGAAAGKTHLQAAGFKLTDVNVEALPPKGVLVVGPGGANQLGGAAQAVARWLDGGGRMLAVGVDEADAQRLGRNVAFKPGEYISAYFAPEPIDSVFRGISPAETHNLDPRTLPLVSNSQRILAGGALATADDATTIFCQLVPWTFSSKTPINQKRTFRTTSRLLTRLLANLGAVATTPLLDRFAKPASPADRRWLQGLYLDQPEEWDFPYRFFRW